MPYTDNVARTNPATLWLFNITIENGPFIVEFPIKTTIYGGFSMAMLNNQMLIFVEVTCIGNCEHLAVSSGLIKHDDRFNILVAVFFWPN